MSQAVPDPTPVSPSPPPREARDNFASFSAGPVDSVTYVAIAALVVIIFVTVASLTYMFRRRSRYWQQHAVEAALQEAADRAARAGKPFVMPVVILQPDGSCQLAEELREECREAAAAGTAQDDGSTRSGGGLQSGSGGAVPGAAGEAAAVLCLEMTPLGQSTRSPSGLNVGSSMRSHAGSASSSMHGPGTPHPPV